MTNVVESIVGIVFGFVITTVALFNGAGVEIAALGIALFAASVIALCLALGLFKKAKVKKKVAEPTTKTKK